MLGSHSRKLRISRHVTFWEHRMISSLSSFHASLSSPDHPFFIDPSIDLFPTSVSPPDTTPCPLPISELTQFDPISALPDLPSVPCEEPESVLVRQSTWVRENPHLKDYRCFPLSCL